MSVVRSSAVLVASLVRSWVSSIELVDVDFMLVEEVVVFFLRFVPLGFFDTVVRSPLVGGGCCCWVCRGRLVVRIDSERVGKSVSIVVVVDVVGLKVGLIKVEILD